jgi:AcrR family transcriptional regulator
MAIGQAPKAPEQTRDRIVEAAIRSLKDRGYAGTSARTIARIGRFNQALIYYYFEDLHDLVVAALEEVSRRRLASYEPRVRKARTFEELVDIAASLFQEDIKAGHLTVLSQVLAASLGDRKLGKRVIGRLEPWIRLVQETLDRLLGGTVLEELVPQREAALAMIAFYMGTEMLYHLERDEERTKTLFAFLRQLAPLVSAVTMLEKEAPS